MISFIKKTCEFMREIKTNIGICVRKNEVRFGFNEVNIRNSESKWRISTNVIQGSKLI